MNCLICKNKMEYYFSKNYKSTPYDVFMKEIETVDYHKCVNCGFTMSKTHSDLSDEKWAKLNYDFHHYHENNDTDVNQPPYIEQATMLKVLSDNHIIDINSSLDYAGGYGTLSTILRKYFNLELPVYDPYVQDASKNIYVKKKDLGKYNTVLNGALFEHIFSREAFDKINSLVSDNGCMIIHTVVCENIPNDSNWFYLEPPVHTTFHTNKSMEILMKQWGYKASLYCLSAKSWILLKEPNTNIETIVNDINTEFQTDYLIYKEGFVDYWKGS